MIGIDEGIIDAAVMAQSADIPYGYISYEIYYDDEIVFPASKRNKLAARAACKGAQFAVVQDPVRGKALVREYGIPEDKLCYMPVAGSGSVPYVPSSYLHDKLGIEREKSIILYMGTLGSWALTDMLAEQSNALPDNYVLVLHGRYGVKNDMRRNYSENQKLFFSTEPVDGDRALRRLVQSAFCCIALYIPTYTSLTSGKNVRDIGMASGKIATALQHGVPILVNEIGQVAHIVRQELCGLVLDMESLYPLNAVVFLESVPNLHSNCHRAFETYFDFCCVKEDFLHMVNACATVKETIGGQHTWEGMEVYLRSYADKVGFRPLVKTALRVVRYCAARLWDRYLRRN